MSKPLLFIGIMSGSSLDGIDVALVELYDSSTSNAINIPNCKLLATHFVPYEADIKDAVLTLHFPQENELEKSALVANQLASLYAEAVNTLLSKEQLTANQISAIGCHGQTIRHQPQNSYTIQLNNHALLAELTNINVVGDFRSRDIAAGGQGAPLVPAFHQATFGSNNQNRAIINIGGIANITALSQTDSVIGFDSGPGNILLDHWVKQHLGKDYDANGEWSSSGQIIPPLLNSMLAEPFFSLSPPKSTGRDLFNAAWLTHHIDHLDTRPQDIARTLIELTAVTICEAIQQHCPTMDEIYICGGGAHNRLLINCLQRKLPHTAVGMTNDLGVDADWVEATAFAWLAQQTMQNRPSNLPAATGAAGARVLGAIYPA